MLCPVHFLEGKIPNTRSIDKMIILQKSCPVCPTFPISLAGWICREYIHTVRKAQYPREWSSAMPEEVFLRAQPRRQWLHQLLGHKELVVSGTLPHFFGMRRLVPRLQRRTRGSATRPCMWGKGNDVPGRNCLETEVSSKATEQAEVLTGAGIDPELLQSCVYQGADGCHPQAGEFSFAKDFCSPS